MDRGGDDFLPKPLDLGEVLKKIQLHLKLEWIYKNTEDKDRYCEKINIESMILPPMDELEFLNNMADIGDIIALQKWAEARIEDMSKYNDFAELMLEMVNQIDTQGIENMVKKAMHRHLSSPDI